MPELQPTQYALAMLQEGKPLSQIIMEAKLPTLGAYLFGFICKSNKSVETIAELISLDRSSLYRTLNGETNAGRNLLLRLSMILNMSVEETQTLLKCGNVASLSGSRSRDIIIMDGIVNHREIDDVNKTLIAHGFTNIYSRK